LCFLKLKLRPKKLSLLQTASYCFHIFHRPVLRDSATKKLPHSASTFLHQKLFHRPLILSYKTFIPHHHLLKDLKDFAFPHFCLGTPPLKISIPYIRPQNMEKSSTF